MGNPFDLPFFSGSLLFISIAPLLLLGLAIPYAVLALRDNREVERDPQVGWKAGLYFMFSLCLLQVLLGLTIYVYDLMDESPSPPMRAPVQAFPKAVPGGPGGMPRPFPAPVTQPPSRPPWQLSAAQRIALGLAVAGLVLGGFHLLLIHLATNARRFPAARRVFLGARLAAHSLVVMGAFTALVVQLVDIDNAPRPSLRPELSILMVWVPSWIVHLVLLSNASRKAPTGMRSAPPRPLPVE
jgi:hypothetical protein